MRSRLKSCGTHCTVLCTLMLFSVRSQAFLPETGCNGSLDMPKSERPAYGLGEMTNEKGSPKKGAFKTLLKAVQLTMENGNNVTVSLLRN